MSERPPNGLLIWRDLKTGELKESRVYVLWHYPPGVSGGDCHELGVTAPGDHVGPATEVSVAALEAKP